MEYFEYLISVIIRQLDTNRDTKEFLRFNGLMELRQIRAFQNMIHKPIEVIVSDTFLDNIDAKIGDVIT